MNSPDWARLLRSGRVNGQDRSPVCRAAFLSILLGRTPIIPDVQAFEVLRCRNGFSLDC